jgi:hypothetical protein
VHAGAYSGVVARRLDPGKPLARLEDGRECLLGLDLFEISLWPELARLGLEIALQSQESLMPEEGLEPPTRGL